MPPLLRVVLPTCAAALGLAGALACGPGVPPAALTQRSRAGELVAELRVQLLTSAEAEKRAVMAETDEASAAAADEAQAADRALRDGVSALAPLLSSLGYEPETALLREFERLLAESERVDTKLLELARGNTNEKAWGLAFGAGAAAADELAARLTAAAGAASSERRTQAQALAAAALLAVREVQVLEAPHIREADDAVMTRLEARMAAAETSARASVAALTELLGPASQPALEGVEEALDRFFQTHAELLTLSRRNTDVRSLALSLGEKRRLTAACDESLIALQESLGKRGDRATR